MKRIDIGQTISILANVGVIAGIAFVAYELRQNNEFLQAQARESVHERRTSINLLLTTTPELASTIDKYDSGEPLSGAEQLVLDGLNRATLATFEWQFGEYRRGRLNYDDLGVASWATAFADTDLNRGLSEYWSVWKSRTNPEFVRFMEDNVIPK